jgi:molecular chaperone GrpE (heat shock protein)
MLGFLKSLFCSTQVSTNAGAERVLELEALVQSLKLDVAEGEKQIQILKKELQLVQNKQERTIDSAVGSEIESLIADMAPAIAQIATQHHLLNVEFKPLQAKDVIAVAMRLIGILEEKGMILDGTIGENVGFDANKHELIGMGSSEQGAQMVVVRMPAVTFQGRVLKRMAVLASPPSA